VGLRDIIENDSGLHEEREGRLHLSETSFDRFWKTFSMIDQ
jgi:hypothetical protein